MTPISYHAKIPASILFTCCLSMACGSGSGAIAPSNDLLIIGYDREPDQLNRFGTHILEDVHEIAGTGTLFPDEEGNPILHMHIACGRETSTVTGCIREGVKVWQVVEVILIELIDSKGTRVMESRAGFKLLSP